jgi:hypothetical protein
MDMDAGGAGVSNGQAGGLSNCQVPPPMAQPVVPRGRMPATGWASATVPSAAAVEPAQAVRHTKDIAIIAMSGMHQGVTIPRTG